MEAEEAKVLRRLAKGPATSVDRFVALRLQERGLVGRVVGVAWTFTITEAGRCDWCRPHETPAPSPHPLPQEK